MATERDNANLRRRTHGDAAPAPVVRTQRVLASDQAQVQVNEAMTQEVFTIGPRSSVKKVVAEMAEHKYGSAVVIDKGHVVGIFTTVGALKALCSFLDEQRWVPPRATRA